MRKIDLPGALERLGFTERGPVVVVVGSAGGLSAASAAVITPFLDRVVVPLCEELGCAVVDGGTDSGVMRLVGTAHARAGASFPLVGVVAAGTVVGSEATVDNPATLEPNHTACVIVPGGTWGDESAWIPKVASGIARGGRLAAVLLGGGEISRADVGHLIDSNVSVFAIRGSGKLADALVEPSTGDAAIDALRRTGRVIPLSAAPDRSSVEDALRASLADV